MNKTLLASRVLAVSGLGVMLRKLHFWQNVVVLTYHRIGDEQFDFDRGLWSATPETFDAQVRFLKSNFDIIGPPDLRDAARRQRGRYVLITFDDGYRDNYEYAFPILRSHHAAATFFIATGFIDNPRPSWWDEIAWMVRRSPRRGLGASEWLPRPVRFDEPDRENAIWTLLEIFKGLPAAQTSAYLDHLGRITGSGRCTQDMTDTWMTWDMLRQMRAGGMWIGGHTVNHPLLGRLGPEAQEREIAGCRQRLDEELHQPMRWFSYPRGKFDAFGEDTKRIAKRQGVDLAFSCHDGIHRPVGWDPYDIRRHGVSLEMPEHQFQAVLTLPAVFV